MPLPGGEDSSPFKDTVVSQPLGFSVRCLSTYGGDSFLLGSTDGRIAVYHLERTAKGQWDAQVVHLYSAKHQTAFEALIPIPEKAICFAATADAVTVHHLPGDWRTHGGARSGEGEESSSASEPLAQLSAVSGLKEVVMCRARRYKGRLMLAVLLNRRLLVYEYAETTAGGGGGRSSSSGGGSLILYKECAPLPEGARCIAWTTKGVLIGCRREYYMLYVATPTAMAGSGPSSSPSSTGGAPLKHLYGSGEANTPFLLSMDPVPEVLIGVNGGICRALPDGSLITGNPEGEAADGAIPGAGGGAGAPPLLSMCAYAHPYLLVGQRHGTGGAQRASLSIYLPLAAAVSVLQAHDSPSSSSSSSSSSSKAAALALCQTLRFGPTHLSRRDLADMDRPLPTKATPVDASTRDVIVAMDEANCLHVLDVQPPAEQARTYASAGRYEMGELVCQLYPNEVPDAVRALVGALGAANAFARGAYRAAMQRLRETDGHAMLAVHFFGSALLSESILRAYTPPAELHPLLLKCSATIRLPSVDDGNGDGEGAAEETEALTALMHFLLEQRLQRGGTVGVAAEEQWRVSTDTALLMVLVLLEKHSALQDLLRGTNWCHTEECTTFIESHRRWVALAVFGRSTGQHERVLRTLVTLAATGKADGPPPGADDARPLPKEVLAALDSLVSTGYTVGEELTPQAALVSRLQGATGRSLLEPHLTQAVALLTTLSYMRGLSLGSPSHRRLMEQHAPWLLLHLPHTALCLSVFISPANRPFYREALSILQGAFRGEGPAAAAAAGGAAPLAAITDFQAMVLRDAPRQLRERPTEGEGGEGEGRPTDAPQQSASTAVGGRGGGSDLAEVHTSYWQNLALLVFGGVAGDTTPLAERRRQLDSFLLHSPFIDGEAAEAFFEDAEIRAASRPERAIVYRRNGRHDKALDMLLDECGSVEDAEAYCAAARAEGRGEGAYLALFHRLFRKGCEEEEGSSSGRPSAYTQDALNLLRNTQGSGSAAFVLPLLPEDLPAREVRDFLLSSLRQCASASHTEVFRESLLAAYERQLACLLAVEESKGVLVTDDPGSHVCALCRKRLRSDTAFLRFPNGVITHVGCVEEQRVCPVTGTEFGKGVVPAVLKH